MCSVKQPPSVASSSETAPAEAEGFHTKDFVYEELRGAGFVREPEEGGVSESCDEYADENDGTRTNLRVLILYQFSTYSFYVIDFFEADEGFVVSAITKDHCCSSANEKKIVSALSKDPKPLRASVNDSYMLFQR